MRFWLEDPHFCKLELLFEVTVRSAVGGLRSREITVVRVGRALHMPIKNSFGSHRASHWLLMGQKVIVSEENPLGESLLRIMRTICSHFFVFYHDFGNPNTYR